LRTMNKRDNPIILFLLLGFTLLSSAVGLWWANQFSFGLTGVINQPQTQEANIAVAPTPITPRSDAKQSISQSSLTTQKLNKLSSQSPQTKTTLTTPVSVSPTAKPKVKPTNTIKNAKSSNTANFAFNGNIKFATESAQLTSADKQTLNSLAQQLKKYDQKKVAVRVVGHTNSYGDSEFNVPLSQQRAQAVANYLRSRGVELNIVARGKGASKPLLGVDSRDTRNQRTEIRLVPIKN